METEDKIPEETIIINNVERYFTHLVILFIYTTQSLLRIPTSEGDITTGVHVRLTENIVS